MRTLFFIIIFGTSQLLFAKGYKEGYYYTHSGEKIEGLLKFNRARFSLFGVEPSVLKFKTAKKSNAIKLTANDIAAFVLEQDSFVVANNLK